MAASIPEGTWIFIVILAVIILAILSNDSISRGSSSSRSSSSSNSGSSSNSDSSDSTERPPRINARHIGDEYIGGSFGVEGSFNAGSASDYDIEASLNGSSVDVSTSGSSFRTEEVNVRDGENEYRVRIQTSVGQDSDSGGFTATNDDPDSSRNPVVRVTDQSYDSDAEKLRLEAQARSRSDADIALTGFVMFSFSGDGFRDSDLEESREVSSGPQHVLEAPISSPEGKIVAGTVRYRAKTRDEEGRTGTYEESFPLEGDIPDGSSDNDGSGTPVDIDMDYGSSDSGTGDGSEISSSADGRDNNSQYPDLTRLIDHLAGIDLDDLGGFQGDEQVMSILEQILEQMDSSSGDSETARAGMNAYQLLLAMNALSADLDTDDNQQIVAELRQIRQQMGGGSMSSDDLESALRTVLHDVFGQDLQGVIQGLDLGGDFDEEAIIQAIESKDIDLSQVTDRLDNIEQAVTQIQSQGGDLSDVEQKLDGIESAVRDLQVDDQVFQDLTDEIRSLQQEGVQVDIDMNDPLIVKLVEDIQSSESPETERQRIIQTIRREGMITRKLLIQLLENDLDDRSGGTGNKNRQNDNDDMADEGTKVKKFDKQELNSLENDIAALSQFVDDFDQLDFQKAQNLKDDIENRVNNIESELNDVHDQAELFTDLVDDMNDFTKGGKTKQDMIDEIENSYKHENKIREELKDVHNKMSEIRRMVKEVEDLITQFSEVLGTSENEFSSTIDSITDDMHKMDSLLEHVNEYIQGHREGQGDKYIPGEVLGEAPR